MNNKQFLTKQLLEVLNEYNQCELNDVEASTYITMIRLANELDREAEKEAKLSQFLDLSRTEGIVRGVAIDTLLHSAEALDGAHNANKHKQKLMTTVLKLEQSNG